MSNRSSNFEPKIHLSISYHQHHFQVAWLKCSLVPFEMFKTFSNMMSLWSDDIQIWYFDFQNTPFYSTRRSNRTPVKVLSALQQIWLKLEYSDLERWVSHNRLRKNSLLKLDVTWRVAYWIGGWRDVLFNMYRDAGEHLIGKPQSSFFGNASGSIL